MTSSDYKTYLPLLLGILLLALGALFFYTPLVQPDAKTMHERFQDQLHQKEVHLQNEVHALRALATNKSGVELFKHAQSEYTALFEDDGILLFYYEGDSLAFWSDNSVPVDQALNRSSFHSQFMRFKNGWFEVYQEQEGDKTFVGILLIKRAYPYQNNYLTNSFEQGFSISPDAEITFDEEAGKLALKSNEGNTLCYIDYPRGMSGSPAFLLLATFFFIGGALLLLVFVRLTLKSLEERTRQAELFWVFPLLLLFLRGVTLATGLPSVISSLSLFDPKFYAASALFPSLGDFLLNTGLLFYLAYYIHRGLTLPKRVREISHAGKMSIAVGIIFSLFLFSTWCEVLIRGLIEDSSIPFDVNDLFDLNFYSYAGLLIVGCLLFTFYLLTDKGIIIIRSSLELNAKHQAIIISVAFSFFLIFSSFLAPFTVLHLMWPTVVVLIVAYLRTRSSRPISFENSIIVVSIFSFFAAYALSTNVTQKELRGRKVIAQKLSNDHDPVSEFLFANMEPNLVNDIALSAYLEKLDDFDSENFVKRLDQLYFTGYFTKYNVKTYVFDAEGNAVYVSDADKSKEDISFFTSMIENHGEETESSRLFFIQNAQANESYLLHLAPLDSATQKPKAHAYISLESKLIPEKIGFPELLLEKETSLYKNLSNYSFAKYRNGLLVYHYGKYSYTLDENGFSAEMGSFHKQEINEYSHMVFRPDEDSIIVVSKANEGFVDKVTTFSYLFGFFSLFVMMVVILKNAAEGQRMESLSFNGKIQLLLVAVILISLILFGAGTIYYINKQNQEKNYTNISEKIQSVLIEVKSKLGSFEKLGAEDQNYMYHILTKFSNVFFTDINLYSKDGALLASSRPKLYSEGLTSRIMNAEAYAKIAVEERSEFIHQEQIGELSYLSAYVPFKNKEGKVLAYLNLSYFAKQSELEKEISSFLVALINIYVFLFAISVVTALIISNIITEPLRLIQQMLSKVELGKTNKSIEYPKNDEIGTLVAIYNDKVAELEKSAELLARSERESAWREMAKQVAHEIKNPLTPMKLSVQYLQRAWNDGAEDWDDKLERFSQTLIEQIDTLSTIASEFSNFAQMPKTVLDKVDVTQVLNSVIELYEKTPGTALTLHPTAEKTPFVYADKDQLIRVFNNLIKNARQAIPEDREGSIDVYVIGNNDQVTIEIKDNGSGIPEEMVDKIFSPSFTTKTGGMGLGLAMVKNIIEGVNGTIWFETTINEGTSFFVSLPLYSED